MTHTYPFMFVLTTQYILNVLNNTQSDISQPQGAPQISIVTASGCTYAIWQFVFYQWSFYSLATETCRWYYSIFYRCAFDGVNVHHRVHNSWPLEQLDRNFYLKLHASHTCFQVIFPSMLMPSKWRLSFNIPLSIFIPHPRSTSRSAHP
jgi:hypothetical protein